MTIDSHGVADWGCNPNEDGLCLCGCGKETNLIGCTRADKGLIKGRHRRLLLGHHVADAPQLATRFQPGNTAAEAKTGHVYLTAIAKRKLAEIAPGPGRNTYAELVVAGWIRDAIKGDASARKTLLDRIDGAVKQTLDVTMKLEELSDEELAAKRQDLDAEYQSLLAAVRAGDDADRAVAQRDAARRAAAPEASE